MTVPLWLKGTNASAATSMKERRAQTLANLEQFGGLDWLILNPDEYPVVYSP